MARIDAKKRRASQNAKVKKLDEQLKKLGNAKRYTDKSLIKGG